MDKTSSLQNLIYGQFRFGSFGFGSVKPTEISVSVVSVFTRFGRTLKPLISGESVQCTGPSFVPKSSNYS